MADLLDLAELESDDPELVPEIVAVDARMSISGKVAKFIDLFERAVSVLPAKEIVTGTAYALFEAVPTSAESIAHARITASDGVQTLSVVADGLRVLMPGTALVPGVRILKILKEAPTDTVRIEITGSEARVRSGRAQWTVKTPLGDRLPPQPNVDGIELHNVAVASFLNALMIARRAVPSFGREALMQVVIRNGVATATDGSRLHRQVIEDFPEHLEMTIPAKVVDELMKALRLTESEHVEVGADEYHLVFKIDDDSIISNRLLLRFPDVESLVLAPAFTNQNTLTVSKAEMLEVIKRIRVNSDPDSSAMFLTLIPDGRDESNVMAFNLAIRSRDPMGNTAQEIMECTWIGSEVTRELCVNHKFLTEFLLVQSTDTVTFRIGNDIKTERYPLYIENHDSGFTGFVQQMRPEYLR